MKLIANITLVTKAGEIPPGGEFDIKDATEAKALVARGFASVPSAKAEADPAPPEGDQKS